VFIAVVVVGSGSYLKNMITNGHPMYPLYGKGHVNNMVLMEMPESLQGKSNLTIFLTSIFAKGVNVSPSYVSNGVQPTLKLPFTLTKDEIYNYNTPDIRMAGFGPLFSGIFCLTIVGIIIMIIDLIKKKDYEKLIPFVILTCLMLILILTLDGSYWARYIPYFYLIPIMVLMHFLQKNLRKNKLALVYSILVIITFIINSSTVAFTQMRYTRNTTNYVQIRMDRLKEYYNSGKELKINLSHHGVQGVLYNLDDYNIKNYTLVDDESLENEGHMFTY
jgi:hypothetical protein